MIYRLEEIALLKNGWMDGEGWAYNELELREFDAALRHYYISNPVSEKFPVCIIPSPDHDQFLVLEWDNFINADVFLIPRYILLYYGENGKYCEKWLKYEEATSWQFIIDLLVETERLYSRSDVWK
jgi:hypothetical protein